MNRELRQTVLLLLAVVSAAGLVTGCPRATEEARRDPVLDPWRNEARHASVATTDPMLEKIKALSSRTRGIRAPASVEPNGQVDPLNGSASETMPDVPPSSGDLDATAGMRRSRPGPMAMQLGPGDELDLVVSGQPEFTGIVNVREDGTVALPTTSDLVEAAGKSPEAFARAVAAAIHPRYMKKEPSVSAVLRASPRLIYYIFGGVRAPGRYAMPPTGITVLDAIMRASRPSDTTARAERVLDFEPLASARYDRVHVFRGASGEPTVVDATSAMLGGAASETRVQPGDVVVVPTVSGEWSEQELRKRLAQESVGMLISSHGRLP
jgi:protein involved in polysaccharide export with SLBB domain